MNFFLIISQYTEGHPYVHGDEDYYDFYYKRTYQKAKI